MEEKSPMRFLIVDDSTPSCALLRVLLEENGYQVVGEASNGAEALRLYKERKPDVITMDLNMPQRSGIEGMRDILALDPAARIIVVTALEPNLVRYECTHVKRYEYVRKPLHWENLQAAIERIERVIP